MARKFLSTFSERLSSWMEIAAGASLVGVMLLIGADIVGRSLGFPVPGAYEIVSLVGGLIVGLALPATSLARGHVVTDFLLEKLSAGSRKFLFVATRLIGILIFMLAGWGMIMMGCRLRGAGEVTAALALPFYHAVWAIGGAFWIQAIILLSEAAGDAKAPRGR